MMPLRSFGGYNIRIFFFLRHKQLARFLLTTENKTKRRSWMYSSFLYMGLKMDLEIFVVSLQNKSSGYTTHIVGCFSSKEKAEEAAKEFDDNDSFVVVENFSLNKIALPYL